MKKPFPSLPHSSSQTLHLLVANPIWPYSGHSFQSANIVIFEMLRELAKITDVKVSLLKVSTFEDKPATTEELQGIQDLKSFGIEILPELKLPKPTLKRSRLGKILNPKMTDFYPEIEFADQVNEAARLAKPDFVLIPWSEWLTAIMADLDIPRYAYYGNPDPKSLLAMNEFNYRHDLKSWIEYAIQRVRFEHFERLHIQEMLKYEILGDVAANDAEYYHHHGHVDAFYIQNLWIDRMGTAWRAERKKYETIHLENRRILGNIGRLAATANTHGLELMARDFLPELKKAMGKEKYEVHMYGSGKAHPSVEPLLNRPEIVRRGFVDDIDRELLECEIFLNLNGGSPYKVGHTRYLHAWSLGCTIVAHKDSALSMPELKHGENCLLGETPREIAGLVKTALSDLSLRQRLGEGGYQTFREFFLAEKVAPKIVAKIKEYRAHHS